MSDYAEDRFHRTLDAALGRVCRWDETDVDALVALFQSPNRSGANDIASRPARVRVAMLVLTSDWLAQRIEQAKAEERERIASAIEAAGSVEERKPFTPYSSGTFDGLWRAARIAREVPRG